MTQEEKAKAYDKVREKIKVRFGTNVAEEIFSEFEETEDERIREEIIEYLERTIPHHHRDEVLKSKEWIAWLEKQGEKLPTGFYYVNSKGEKFYSDTFKYGDVILHVDKKVEINPSEFDLRLNKLLKQFENLPKEELTSSLSFYLNVVQNDGTYREEKPSDKIELKFKVGDWVVYYRNDSSREVLQVYDIRDGRYYFTDNVHFSWSVKECDEKSHLWTIQDARDGDVLINAEGKPFIFKGLLDAKHPNCPVAYGGVCINCYDVEEFCISKRCHWWCDLIGVKPATKEQRDLLFQNMREAGYEWDDEKRELKKIEQKSAWSEEDTFMYNRIKNLLTDISLAPESRKSLFDWLKSLKQRYTWKPSDMQMKALHDLNITGGISYIGQGQELINLYNDLKKL